MDRNEPATHDDPGLEMDPVPQIKEELPVLATHDDSGVPNVLDDPVLPEGSGTNTGIAGQVQASRMHLCVNCNIDTRRLRRHTLEHLEVRSVVQQWVTTVEVTAKNILCHPCWTLAWNVRNLQSTGELQLGHRHVCVNCGRSLNRARSHRLHNDFRVKSIIEEWIIPQQVRSSSEICHSCWQRASRAATNNSAPSTAQGHLNEPPQVQAPVLETVSLPNYIRVPVTQQHCFYPGCYEQERLSVPASLRARLFCDYNVYVPPACRVCRYHILHISGDVLAQVDNPIHTFNASQIEDFVSLLKEQLKCNFDFENIETMDNHLLHYWFGFSKEQFSAILNDVPQIKNMHRGPFALGAYLIKLRTGDSNERISSLFNVPRKTLEELMGEVRELLQQDCVPLNLRIIHMKRKQIS